MYFETKKGAKDRGGSQKKSRYDGTGRKLHKSREGEGDRKDARHWLRRTIFEGLTGKRTSVI